MQSHRFFGIQACIWPTLTVKERRESVGVVQLEDTTEVVEMTLMTLPVVIEGEIIHAIRRTELNIENSFNIIV